MDPVVTSHDPYALSSTTGEPPTFHGPRFGVSVETLRAAVNAACNCGGKPLGEGCCPACEVWHRITRKT